MCECVCGRRYELLSGKHQEWKGQIIQELFVQLCKKLTSHLRAAKQGPKMMFQVFWLQCSAEKEWARGDGIESVRLEITKCCQATWGGHLGRGRTMVDRDGPVERPGGPGVIGLVQQEAAG